jgi:hypothetical protein
MGLALKSELGLLGEDEREPVARSHHPVLASLPGKDVLELARWLRARRDRARGLIRHTARVRRGKAEPRRAPPEPHAERGLSAKKQVFSRALRRVNARLDTLAAEARRARALADLHVALRAGRGVVPHHPEPGWTAGRGTRPKAGGPHRRTRVDPRQVGSV